MAVYKHAGIPQAATVSNAAAALATGSAAIRVIETTVDASAGGVAQETAICTIPAGSLVLCVEAEVVTPFDGDLTTTLEVGLTGNTDKYVDTVDFDPSAVAGTKAGSIGGTTNDQKVAEYLSAAEAVVATWTNTANATAGSVKVRVVYVDVDDSDLKTQVDALRTALNSLIANLKATKPHGLVAS